MSNVNEQRDELARDIFMADNKRALPIHLVGDWEALCKAASSTPSGNTYAHNIADGLFAAGYRKPRSITTAEELDALPVEAVVRSLVGVVWEKDTFPDGRSFWVPTGACREYPARHISLPAIVLHEPTTEATK